MSPASETGTPSTPQRANASGQCDSKIESTPNSHGTSVVSENISLVDVQVKEVQPWIQRDIKQAKQCKADAMLQVLLQRASCAPEMKQPELLQTLCLKGVLPVCNGQVSDGMVAKIFWGEAGRTSEPKILDKVEEIAKVHQTVEGHIPELLWHHAFTNPTSAIREALGVPEPSMGSRVLYILVFRKLHPITKLHGKEIFDAWKNGKLIGVLNDYDLSSLADDLGPRGNERTGTVPSMALDLLTEKAQRGEVKHIYRHDLESFIWVFTWIFLRYRQGVLLPRRLRLFDEWATLGAISCGKKKLAFLANAEYQPVFETSESDVDWFIWDLLVECFEALDAAAYNRRSHVRRIHRVQQRSMEGAGEQTNAKETISDMDDLLGKFTGTMAWARLSNTSPI
ncbi:uncharacterized protein F5147DRAFT_763603 [Suillus discolor]|uniref:Fungal-type protein kinase domain-containing protein n=1 Tax=Suillus discolor TaxID=1912936 RepID=A0A9P7JPK8_9AGAM|nr:uncharacterized protein F5147DRAFT_763603 [Suillus discolor]KAG2096093.1 hypothetical protein F5147DRAFT_763603 [Suillus discolor]